MQDLVEILGNTPGMIALRAAVTRLLQRPGARELPPILVLGETGTGKGLLARAIHRAGPRSAGPFVEVNCAAIPDNLIEAELFGYERGAFTDARQAKPGLFQAASGGTLFLDEVGLLPEAAQAKLLKAIEDRAVRRLGRTRPEPVDVSIITATNADLAEQIRARRFRADLYHRVAVIMFTLPPLRERAADVPLLAEHFLTRACQDYGLLPRTLTADARAALRAQPWPGNVRELANVIERTVLLADGEDITAAMLSFEAGSAQEPSSSTDVEIPNAFHQAVESTEREHIARALEATGGNLSRTAARLGIARNTLRYRIERLGIGSKTGRSHSRPPRSEAAAKATLPPLTAAPTDAPMRRRVVAALRVRLGGPRETDSFSDRSRLLAIGLDRLRVFGGRIEELGVEGCVAFFGLDPVEDAPRRAAYAAIAARQALGRQSGPGQQEPSVRMALHVLPMTLFRVGDQWQLDPASREDFLETLRNLVDEVADGEIVVTAGGEPFLDRHFALAPASSGRGLLRLTGTSQTTHELWGRATRFVGRVGELEALQRVAEEGAAGRGRVVGVRGEPGSGKSRLLAELAREVAGPSARWLETSCASYGTGVPFLPVIALLRKCLQLETAAPAELVVERVREHGPGPDAHEEFEAPILSLLDNLSELHPFMMLPAPHRRGLVVSAAARLLLSAGRRHPLVIVVEDLQWIDRESQDVLDALVQEIHRSSVVLVATYRPDYQHAWHGRPSFSETQLEPLSRHSAGELLDDLLGDNISLVKVRAELLEKTGGNPFYLEESVRALADSGVVSGSRGAFRAAGLTSSLALPENVGSVVAARIDQLPARRRQVLHSAAAIGQSGPLRLLVLISGLPDAIVRDEVGALRDAAFFQPSPREKDSDSWEFRHALTQEAAYAGLLDLERKLLHATVLKSMEQLWSGTEGEHAEMLAHQAMCGEVWDRAIDYLRMASARAYARAALEDAIGRLETALRLVERLPASIETARRAIDVRLDLHPALMTVGRVREIAELHPEAERFARQIADGVRLAQVLRHRSQFSWMGGRYRMGADYARQALTTLGAVPDNATRLQATYSLGTNLHALGDYRGAERCFAWIVEGPDAAATGRVLSLTVPVETPGWCWRGYSLAMTGDFARGEAAIRRGLQLADASGYAQSQVIGRTIEGLVMAHAGRPAERLQSMQATIALCEKIGFVAWLPGAYSTYGFMLTRAGHMSEVGLQYLEQGVALMEKMGIRVYLAQRYCWWAEGLLRAGMTSEARRRADAAVDLAVTMEERGVEAEALLVRALVGRAEGAPEKACQDLERASAISQALEARPLEAHCHLALGAVLENINRSEATARHDRGLAECREMGVNPWWPDYPVVV